MITNRVFLLLMCTMALFSNYAFAQRQLGRDEVLSIFKSLTNQPRTMWITNGTISAKHHEFRAAKAKDANCVTEEIRNETKKFQADQNSVASEDVRKLQLDAIPFNVRYKQLNSYTMDTQVLAKIDGQKFYWQIDVENRADSIKPDLELANNYMTDQFDLNGNRNRIFTWDGQQYNMYMRPINHAIITDSAMTGAKPVINGPLTAGYIPWGKGIFSYDEMAKAELTAFEVSTGCVKTIELNLRYSNLLQWKFILDPDKAYAVLSCTRYYYDSITVNTYGNFLLLSGKWIPTTILTESYNTVVEKNNLVASDSWNFTNITESIPSSDDFKIPYENDAFVTYHSAICKQPIMYYYSKPVDGVQKVDSSSLVADKLELAGSTASKNCATAAMTYTLTKLGKKISADVISAQLLNNTENTTSLADMKRAAENLGLYTYAVHLNSASLKKLKNCQVILHLPEKKHYVVLGDMDEEYIRVIDLTDRKIYDRIRIYEFETYWTGGTALVIANKPLQLDTSISIIENSELGNIVGASGYSCTNLLQEYDIVFCDSVGNMCGGTYQEYEERYGCQADTSGTCSGRSFLRYKDTLCLDDICCPGECYCEAVWVFHYMRACS